MKTALLILALLISSTEVLAQKSQAGSHLDDIAITPSRHELIMAPGTEKTVIVNIMYTSSGMGKSSPARLIAYTNDWTIDKNGALQFYTAGTRSESATGWIIHSPVELTISPGDVVSIRVTVSVPRDATPGDHTAALILEPRPEVLKNEPNRKQLQARFRIAAIFYVMVPQLTTKPSLQDLRAETSDKGILVIPRIRNEGNSHIRPIHSVKIVDRAGVVAAELTNSEWLPVLGGTDTDLRLLIEKTIPPGSYTVRYRVDFGDGSQITEGQTELVVRERIADSTIPAADPDKPKKGLQLR